MVMILLKEKVAGIKGVPPLPGDIVSFYSSDIYSVIG